MRGRRVNEPRCPLCDCPTRLHAPVAAWCARCATECPGTGAAGALDGTQGRVEAAPVAAPRDRTRAALERYAARGDK